jgi:hypothetical protein
MTPEIESARIGEACHFRYNGEESKVSTQLNKGENYGWQRQ